MSSLLNYKRPTYRPSYMMNDGWESNRLRWYQDAVATDAVISFKTAFWFWMTPQSPKPSAHAVITGGWTPSAADCSADRVPGYGVITNIINGGVECGHGSDDRVADRIGFYKRYCDLMGVPYGDDLDCYNQRPFNG
ncbi:hypothetical protein AMTR_s00001p00244170 [Amborella trichopoda]|uniref:Glycoside hydrolase family 19 catalytic domain-containing protein n=1 Tax=Amborella trichopoda TaxID=13333 RepID=W1NMC6_AMBTC|nr:hypothetical protein AMTR_s00001p00244170 [Amborella trichopoda]